MTFSGIQGEYFEIDRIDHKNCGKLLETKPDTLRLLWFTSDNNQLKIDDIPHTFNRNEILTLTQYHKLEYTYIDSINLLRFNRSFYCILDHDSEVGCKGVLYFGAAAIPVIKAEDQDLSILETAWKMAQLELENKDNLQQEMLQMMLRRILILCTRIHKKQHGAQTLNTKQHNLVREFNFLVEANFREKHAVSDYAEMLFKSPKTISNTFKKIGDKTPLQYIQERIALEARRLLFYTNRDISEIAYLLGFADIQTFSRFFKKQESISPSEYRNER